MAKAKTIVCLLCRKEVDFIHEENNQYLDHLKTQHNINFYLHLTLMINLMDKESLDYFSNVTPITNPKTLACILCQKQENFSHEESDQYFSHLKNEHKIVFNLHLIRSINLMDKDGLKGIIKKFEETYEVDDSATDHAETSLDNSNDVNDFVKNDYANLDKNSKNEDEEKMMVEEESELDDSLTSTSLKAQIAQKEQEEMYGELEEELINGSEAMNYYKSQSVDASKENSHMMEKSKFPSNVGYDQSQSEELLNESTYSNASFPNDSLIMNGMNGMMEDSFNVSSSGDMSFPVGGEFDSMINPVQQPVHTPVINQAGSQGLSSEASVSQKTKKVKSEPELKSHVKNEAAPDQKGKDIEFAMAIQKEIEEGTLSITQQIPFPQTHKKMKELTGLFSNKTQCGLCERMFNNKSHLHEHIESIHNSLPVYFCHVCQKPMTSSARHRQHKKKCTG